MRLGDDGRDRRNDHDDVTQDGNRKGEADGSETTEMSICEICAKERYEVDPELIEGANSCGGLLAHVQRAGLSVKPSPSSRAFGQRLLDEVGDFCWSAIMFVRPLGRRVTYKPRWFRNMKSVRPAQRMQWCRPSMESCLPHGARCEAPRPWENPHGCCQPLSTCVSLAQVVQPARLSPRIDVFALHPPLRGKQLPPGDQRCWWTFSQTMPVYVGGCVKVKLERKRCRGSEARYLMDRGEPCLVDGQDGSVVKERELGGQNRSPPPLTRVPEAYQHGLIRSSSHYQARCHFRVQHDNEGRLGEAAPINRYPSTCNSGWGGVTFTQGVSTTIILIMRK